MNSTDRLQRLAFSAALGAALSLAAIITQAATVLSTSPQGEVRDVRQVAVQFDVDIVALGQVDAPAPVRLQCTPNVPAGQGRWVGPRRWAFEFAQDVPAGVRCTMAFTPGLKALNGEEVALPASAGFYTGAPRFTEPYPNEGTQVAEDQVFLLKHAALPPDAQAVAADFRCEVREETQVRSVGVALATSEQRSLALHKAPSGTYALALRCAEALPNDRALRLRYVPRIAGVPEQQFNYTVRPVFTAKVNCTVLDFPKGSQACDPRQAVSLAFSNPVNRDALKDVEFKHADGQTVPYTSLLPYGQSNVVVRWLQWAAPQGSFGEGAVAHLNLPANLRDVDGRALTNAADFPKTIRYARLPPYLGAANPLAVMPLVNGAAQAGFAVRNLEASLPLKAWRLGGELGADIELYALELLQGQANGQWPQPDLSTRVGPPREGALATSGAGMAFATVALTEPGLHIVRADSPAFAAYLDSRKQDAKNKPELANPQAAPYPQRYAVVQATNLNPSASLSNVGPSQVWVTALDTAQPVAGADVAIYSCQRDLLWRGTSNAQGLADVQEALRGKLRCANNSSRNRWRNDSAWLVVRAGRDMVWTPVYTGWSDPRAAWGGQPVLAHTVLDRRLFKAGETVHMQHLVRLATHQGFALPTASPLTVDVFFGWGDKLASLTASLAADGSASTDWIVPTDAKLGSYRVVLSTGTQQLASTEFQVEEFRTPVIDAQLRSKAVWEGSNQLVKLQGSLRYFASGAAAGVPVSLQHAYVHQIDSPRPGYSFFESRGRNTDVPPQPFSTPELRLDKQGAAAITARVTALNRPTQLKSEMRFADPSGETQTVGSSTMLWPDTLKLGLRTQPGPNGSGLQVQGIALDKNDQAVAGETVTVRVKPLRSDGKWSSPFQEAGPAVDVCSAQTNAKGEWQCEWQLPAPVNTNQQDYWLFTARADSLKHSLRPVHTDLLKSRWELGWVAQRDRGVLELAPDGQLARDRQVEDGIGGPRYAPGGTATVIARPERLPAHLLLNVEREGVITRSVHALTQIDQRISVPLPPHFAPNVHLTARYAYPLLGVAPDQPASSQQRVEVAIEPDAFRLNVSVQPANSSARPRSQVPVQVTVKNAQGQPMAKARVTLVAVDQALLALKPNDTWAQARRMISRRGNAVQTSALDTQLLRQLLAGPRPTYLPRDEADRGRFDAVPAPAPVAAMSARLAEAGKGSADSTAPRTDLSSLILWRTDLVTDAQGLATATLTLNDALTEFRIVALVNAGADQFGEGEARLTSTQPLQIFSGLPQLLRSDDELTQQVTLRNTGTTPLTVTFRAQATLEAERAAVRAVVPAVALALRGLQLERQLTLAPNQSQDVAWPIAVPSNVVALHWRISAQAGPESDALNVTQRVTPALPVTVRQASLVAVADGGVSVPVAQPTGALPLRGGLRVDLQASLVEAALKESTRWMAQYPYTCLEQQTSRFVALNDRASWDRLMRELPRYLDGNSLARFFPQNDLLGSEMLTVQLLDLAKAANWPVPEAPRQQMLNALSQLLQGRLREQDWAPESHLQPRQLAAQATLAEQGQLPGGQPIVRPKDLSGLPAQSLIDWARTLLALPAGAARDAELQQATEQLRTRWDVQGTRLRWRNESALHWWWFMWSADSSAARAALLAQQLAATNSAIGSSTNSTSWRADAPLITQGLVGRQADGRWSTTVGNAWSTLALRRFQAQFEAGPISGSTRAALGSNAQESAWKTSGQPNAQTPPYTATATAATTPGAATPTAATASTAPAPATAPSLFLPWPNQGAQDTLRLSHEGSGKPWATVSVLAAVPNTQPVSYGLSVKRTVTPVEQKRQGKWTVGDVMRVRLELESTAVQTWVVVRDALPSGSSHIGRGLGRESSLAQREERSGGWTWPSYVERATESYRAYFRWIPRGRWQVEYTVRLNNAGNFKLPPVRVEAMYAPEVFGEDVAQTLKVGAR